MEQDNNGSESAVTPAAPADRAGSFLTKLLRAAENLVNLQVATIVGDVELSGDIKHPRISFPGDDTAREESVIVTNVNLVESDITTVIPSKYENDIDGPIMKYHANQVAQANESMDKKLQLIQALITDFVPKFSSTPANS